MHPILLTVYDLLRSNRYFMLFRPTNNVVMLLRIFHLGDISDSTYYRAVIPRSYAVGFSIV